MHYCLSMPINKYVYSHHLYVVLWSHLSNNPCYASTFMFLPTYRFRWFIVALSLVNTSIFHTALWYTYSNYRGISIILLRMHFSLREIRWPYPYLFLHMKRYFYSKSFTTMTATECKQTTSRNLITLSILKYSYLAWVSSRNIELEMHNLPPLLDSIQSHSKARMIWESRACPLV